MAKEKLKTLKDFVSDSNVELVISLNKLKREAIKWILMSERKKFYCMVCDEFDCDCSSSECFKIYHLEEVVKSKRCFFNITERELPQSETKRNKNA